MKTRAVVLAGGEGSRLGVLTAKRTKPAVPFAGKYRIIDFALSNCVNSGIFDVMLLAQYRPHSLIQHIGAGRPWDLDRSFTGGVHIHTPYKGRADADWYRGTADAIQQNLNFVKDGDPDLVLVLSGDHIYEMDYDPLIVFHADHRADVTVCAIRVSLEDAPRFGILSTANDFRITSFVEKPKDPPGRTANMGVYIFTVSVLEKVLLEDARRRDSSHDFGRDILPRMITDGYRVFAFPYNGYWMDVGTVESYWQAHMGLLSKPPTLDLNSRSWVIHTRSEERPPVWIEAGAQVVDSLITDGSVIARGARIERSILSPGVVIGPGAVVRESIVLTDARIDAGAVVERSILDKLVHVGAQARVGEIVSGAPDLGLTTLGKACEIPAGAVVPRGMALDAGARTAETLGRVGRKSKEAVKA